MCAARFKFEDDLLKHHVRLNGWLPVCRHRLRRIREIDDENGRQQYRRLRYFTFCAVGAVDVLMLDVARVIRRSRSGRFDTVAFFDKTPEDILETIKRIPGATGFPGDFLETVLLEDPDEEMIVDAGNPVELDDEIPGSATEFLKSETNDQDTKQVRERQSKLYERQSFIKTFPFDVINLDLETFLFKPNDAMPGQVISALRKILEWQKREVVFPQRGEKEGLREFTLMFTTQIGPPNLSQEYLDMLVDRIRVNMDENADLRPIMEQRTGISDIQQLMAERFDEFFKIAMPKVLAALTMEEDWYIDSTRGIKVFEFDRPAEGGNYKMLHMVMDLARHEPPKEQRAPGQTSQLAQSNYNEVVRGIFSDVATVVTQKNIDVVNLQASLDLIKTKGVLYSGEE